MNETNKPKYWIPESRYYELKQYCRCYNTWKAILADIDSFAGRTGSCVNTARSIDYYSVERKALVRKAMTDRIEMVDSCIRDCDKTLGKYIFEGVVTNKSYDDLTKAYDLGVTKAEYYLKFRKFFYLLHTRKTA